MECLCFCTQITILPDLDLRFKQRVLHEALMKGMKGLLSKEIDAMVREVENSQQADKMDQMNTAQEEIKTVQVRQ